jgi:hypothetical protein
MVRINIVLLALATWRISSLFARESGPFDIFAKFRKLTGAGMFARGLACVWCNSVWFGLLFAALSIYSVNILSYIFVALSLSTTSIIIDEILLYLGRPYDTSINSNSS